MAYDNEADALDDEARWITGDSLTGSPFGSPPPLNLNAPQAGDIHPRAYYYPPADTDRNAPTANLSDDGRTYTYTGTRDDVYNKFFLEKLEKEHEGERTVSPDGKTVTYKIGDRVVAFTVGADGRLTYTDTDQKASIAQRYPQVPPADASVQGPLNRERIRQELLANPDLILKAANMIKGETGGIRASNHSKQLIQLESAMNRALIRGISFREALLSVGESRKGYYAIDTYRAATLTQAEIEEFRTNLLAPALNGSNESTRILGFIVTGNASAGVADRDVIRECDRGQPHGGHGKLTGETYVLHLADYLKLKSHPGLLAMPTAPVVANGSDLPSLKVEAAANTTLAPAAKPKPHDLHADAAPAAPKPPMRLSA